MPGSHALTPLEGRTQGSLRFLAHARLNKLTSLKFYECRGIGVTGIAQLNGMTQLKSLSLTSFCGSR